MKLALMTELIAEVQDFETKYPELVVLGFGVSAPEPRLNLVEVPGRNAPLDLTDAIGPVTFETRQVWFSCREFAGAKRFLLDWSTLLNRYHGQRVRVVFDDDPGYFYEGRCSLELDYINNDTRDLHFVLIADPYKYPVYSSDENWLWDPFNFETGVIRVYSNINVNGTRIVDVIAYEQPESPKFNVTLASGQASMRMLYDGDTYYLNNGANSFPQITITSADVHTDLNRFTFIGRGTVSINLKGGIL